MFLGIVARVTQVSETECKLAFTENPLTDFVELPEKLQPLSYCR